MGDMYDFDGEIQVDPPLNFKEIKAVTAALHTYLVQKVYNGKPPRYANIDPETFNIGDHYPLALRVEEQEMDTDEGTLTVKRAATIAAPSSEGYGGRSTMVSQMEVIIKALPKHTFKGSVTMIEDSGSSGTKLVVDGRKANEYKGTGYIKFEDGSEEKILN